MSEAKAQPFPTDIDRRKCDRVVPMKVLVLGLSRTGTSSIRKALKQLGYDDCYHYLACLVENPRDSDMWVEAFEAKFEGKGTFGREDWDQLLGHCMAVTDTPCNVFAEELLEAYPNAKVILSIRDNIDVWYASYMNALQPFWDWFYEEPGLWGMIRRALSNRQRDDGMAWKLLQHTYYKDFEQSAKRHYVEHNERIRRLAKEQNREFLQFNVKQGWQPLCKFLGEPVPDTPFPFGNDTKEMQGLVRAMKDDYDSGIRKNALKVLGVVSVGVATLAIWLAKVKS